MTRIVALTLLLSCIFIQHLSGQKNHRYLDLHGNVITKMAIKEQSDPNNTTIIGTRKIGKITEHRLFQRQYQGILDTNSLASLLGQLEGKTGDGPQEDADNSHFILINYYPGADRCNTSGIATPQDIGRGYHRFLRQLKNKDNISVFNIYKDDKKIERWSQNRTWYEDENQLIENLFFNYHFYCGSHVVIDRVGNYIVYYGECILDQKLDNIQDLKAINE